MAALAMKEMSLKLLARTQMMERYTTLDSLDVIKDLGFDGVEISYLRKDFTRIPLEDMPIREIKDRVDSLGLYPVSVSMHGDFANESIVADRLLQVMPSVRDLDARILITNGPLKQAGDEEAWARMVSSLRPLVAGCRSAGYHPGD
jgi:sugar phosphate isomerase/epimerase